MVPDHILRATPPRQSSFNAPFWRRVSDHVGQCAAGALIGFVMAGIIILFMR